MLIEKIFNEHLIELLLSLGKEYTQEQLSVMTNDDLIRLMPDHYREDMTRTNEDIQFYKNNYGWKNTAT